MKTPSYYCHTFFRLFPEPWERIGSGLSKLIVSGLSLHPSTYPGVRPMLVNTEKTGWSNGNSRQHDLPFEMNQDETRQRVRHETGLISNTECLKGGYLPQIMLRQFTAALLGLLLCSTSVEAGDPGIRGFRKGFAQVGYSGLYYTGVFSPTGSKTPAYRNASDVTFQLYAEYGIAKGWEIRGLLPYKLLRTERSTNLSLNPTPSGMVNAVGNIGLGLKRALLNGPVKLSIGADALANTFTGNNRLGLRSGYEGWTLLPYISVGSDKKRTYYYAQTGYGFMTQNYSNFLKLSGELGYRLHARLWVAGTIDARLVAKTAPFFNTEAYQFAGTYLNNQQYVRAGARFTYTLVTNKLGVSGSATGVLTGQNIPVARVYNAGIFIKW